MKKFYSFIEKLCTPKKLGCTALILILAALLTPIIFTRSIGFPFAFNESTGHIGDTFGIMNPFIAIIAAIITFAAFWIQYQANTEMINDNKQQREENQKEQENIRISNRKQQIITRFYEMLKIHRDNVKELEWISRIHYTKEIIPPKKGNAPQKNTSQNIKNILEKQADYNNIPSTESGDEYIQRSGRQIFFYYMVEFNIIYNIVDILHSDKSIKKKTTQAYNIFYKGTDDVFFDYNFRNLLRDSRQKCTSREKFFETVSNSELIKNNPTKGIKIKSVLENLLSHKDFFSLQPPFCGHFEKLNNYYRHLFLTVKTIANENEKYLSYPEKRDLLRILRAQLTNTEQIMLFYNWFSENGKQWEAEFKEGNHFFTQFRMIHNITPNRIIPFQTKDGNYIRSYNRFMNYFTKCQSIQKYGTKDDPIFEFEDWEDHPKFNYTK